MISTPRRIKRGSWGGVSGVFWAWPVDEYWDVHLGPENGREPDGSDVVSECHPTFEDARRWVREVVQFNRVISGRS